MKLLEVFLIFPLLKAKHISVSEVLSNNSWFHSLQTVPSTTVTLNSILVLGDWGNPDKPQGMLDVATQMKEIAKTQNTLAVVTVGDNFYTDGVDSVNDPKFNQVWKDTYNGVLAEIPWFVSFGNHDWYGKPQAEIDHFKMDDRWIMPSHFFNFTLPVANGKKAVFVMIDTNLFNYGYNADQDGSLAKKKRKLVLNNFKANGWVESNNAMEKQLSWIDTTLRENSAQADYLFVAGHHFLQTCSNQSPGMIRLDQILKQHGITAYLSGHHHTLGSYSDQIMYIQSGCGGESSKICSESKGWSVGDVFGFVNMKFDSAEVTFDFIDSTGSVLHSVSAKPRNLK